MSTIKDIAKEAGVSIATVSIVLNGKGKERKISEETQTRIYTIAQQLNYVPNQSAKKLRVAQEDSYAIAFYWATDFRINYLARITLGIQEGIMKQNKNIRLTVMPYKVDQLEKLMKSTQNEFFNGIIIANMSDKDMEQVVGGVWYNKGSVKISWRLNYMQRVLQRMLALVVLMLVIMPVGAWAEKTDFKDSSYNFKKVKSVAVYEMDFSKIDMEEDLVLIR